MRDSSLELSSGIIVEQAYQEYYVELVLRYLNLPQVGCARALDCAHAFLGGS